MTLKELLALTRARLKDVKAPLLWADADLTQALNEAQWQACRRARLIKDSTTEDVCRLDLDVSTALYKVDERVMFIRRVKLNSMARPLKFMRVRDMDEQVPGWESHAGQVTHWIPDYSSGKLRLYRAPDATTTLPDFATLTVVRGPLNDMKDSADEPEINRRHHYKLHHHACALLLSDQDAETYDAEAAAKHAKEFALEFGEPSSAAEETWLEENVEFAEDVGVY